MSMSEMESKIRELRSLQRLIEEAEQEAEAIKDGIKAQLTAQGVDELQAGEYRVSWKAVTSSRLDGKALKAALVACSNRPRLPVPLTFQHRTPTPRPGLR